jgi:PKD repeat protein
VNWTGNTWGYNTHSGAWTNGHSAPYAYFVASSEAGNPPLDVYFVDMSVGASGWNWDFGDGSLSSERSPFHRYTNFARSTAMLRVSGALPEHSATVVITNDITAPTGTVLINAGENFTTNPIVNLTLSATDNSSVVVEMRFSNTNDQAWADWEAYATNRVWALASGIGQRTVYAQFRDHAGNVSAVTNDTIMLDTTPLPVASFNLATSSQVEDDADATIEVFLNMPFTRDVTVAYATADETAAAGSDYIAATGMLTFAAGQTNQAFSLRLLEDEVVELNETLILSLTVVSNATTGPPLAFTIFDEDPPAVSFGSGVISASEEGGVVTVAVVLAPPSGQSISVSYATTTNGTAIPGQDFQPANGVLVFGPGQTNRTFSIMIADDALDELSEIVPLILFSPTNAVLGAASATLTILDDDPPSARFSGATYFKSEGPSSSPATVNVWLTKPYSQAARIDWSITGGTATAGADYPDTVFGGQLFFLPNETNQSFQITIRPDSEVEGDETIELELTGFAGAGPGFPTQATLTIIDDEVPPRVLGASREETGSLSISLLGAVGQRFAVQTSTNLPEWFHWRTFTNVTGTMVVTDSIPASPGLRFYRTTFPAP